MADRVGDPQRESGASLSLKLVDTPSIRETFATEIQTGREQTGRAAGGRAVHIAFFERSWDTYHSIVAHDLMDHQALTSVSATALRAWLRNRPPAAQANGTGLAMVDLGCGDLSALAPLLRELPLGSYTGMDLTASVLPRASATLGPVPYPTHWEHSDLLSWAAAGDQQRKTRHQQAEIDILHSAFAIHHLNDDDKEVFLRGARQRIAPNGLFLWADVFRRPGEAEAEANRRYCDRVFREWSPLSAEEKRQTTDHIQALDHPADRAAIQTVAEACGWQWQWLWQGHHDSEALAKLTPA